MRLITTIIFGVFLVNYSFARDPGTGSNTTVEGVGPSTPDAKSDSTSIMGGGTPGNDGEDTFNLKDPTPAELKKIKQLQEENNPKKQNPAKNN